MFVCGFGGDTSLNIPDTFQVNESEIAFHGFSKKKNMDRPLVILADNEKGFKDYSVGTIEGYPTFDTMVAQVKANGTKKVLLMPFMFVAGDHAKNDIAGDWKEELEKKGYEVSVFMEGLGQNPDIQKIFIEHARFMAKHKMIDIVDKKKAYAVEKD